MRERDHELLDRVRTRDEAAFKELVARHEPRISRLVRRRLTKRHVMAAGSSSQYDAQLARELEDTVQDVFLVLLEKPPELMPRQSLYPWLERVAIQKVSSRRRDLFRMLRGWRKYWGDGRRTPPSPHSGPLGSLLLDERSKRVFAALDALANDEREIVESYYFDGQPDREIAHALGKKTGAVRTRRFRARKKLVRQLEDLLNQ